MQTALRDQARTLRSLIAKQQAATPVADVRRSRLARVVAITSGKGGVGKSLVALNLAVSLAKGGARVALLDANEGVGSLELLCGLSGYWNLAHVLSGARRLADIELTGPHHIRLIPGGSSLAELSSIPELPRQQVLAQLEALQADCDVLIVDTGAGAGSFARRLSRSADEVLVVTTTEPTAIADAYATIKTLAVTDGPDIGAVINQADDVAAAEQVLQRLQQTSRTFLQTRVVPLGVVPFDPVVPRAVRERVPFVERYPASAAAQALTHISDRLRSIRAKTGAGVSYFQRLLAGRDGMSGSEPNAEGFVASW